VRCLLVPVLLGAVPVCQAQQILIRRQVLPPPTTFVGLKQLRGPEPTGPCHLPAATLSPDSVTSIALSDSSTLHFPQGWREVSGFSVDSEVGRTVVAGPGESRVRILRERNGAVGRHYQGDEHGDPRPGVTCEVDRGDVGAIWTFYAPDSVQVTWPRPYLAFGEIITPRGSRYTLTLSAHTSDERAQMVAIVTEAGLQQR
jgi:hypothetical protein